MQSQHPWILDICINPPSRVSKFSVLARLNSASTEFGVCSSFDQNTTRGVSSEQILQKKKAVFSPFMLSHFLSTKFERVEKNQCKHTRRDMSVVREFDSKPLHSGLLSFRWSMNSSRGTQLKANLRLRNSTVRNNQSHA